MFSFIPTERGRARAGRRWGLSCAALLLTLPLAARSESSLRLPLPESFGEIHAGTYDDEGHRVGPAAMRIQRLDDGRVRLALSSGFSGAARTEAEALLAPDEDGRTLRLLSETSRSRGPSGEPLGVMQVDHVKGVARCLQPGQSAQDVPAFALPAAERVANVPLTLLFQKLVEDGAERVEFQIFVCTGGPRLIDARAARVGAPAPTPAARGLVEVRYDLDLGPILGALARAFVPRMSVWFDPAAPHAWIGHRMPLYGRGPTVWVVRSGFAPSLLSHTP